MNSPAQVSREQGARDVPDVTNHRRDASGAGGSLASTTSTGPPPAQLEFRVLGSFEVLAGGVVLDLGPPQQRALLALLVLEAGRIVSADALVAQLWGDDPPASAAGTVQAYISQLRRVLEPTRPPRAPATVLVTRGPGYQLDVPPDLVDATRYLSAADAGRALLAAGDPAAAEQVLLRAAQLWRGEPLPEFRDTPWAAAAAARLVEARATIGAELADTWLATGRNAAVATATGELLAEHPYRERLWQQLILALYRDGRQAEALDAYRRAATTLDDDLGLAPGRELQQLQDRILRHDPSLDLVPPARPARPAQNGRLEPLPKPAQPSPAIVGRTEQLATLAGLIDTLDRRAAVALVVGEAGVGKTSLVQAAAAQAVARGATVAWGRCSESGSTPAFWPWLSVVRAVGGERADDVAALLSGEAARSVGSGPEDDLDAARFRRYEEVLSQLRHVAQQRPLVVVIEDLHAADPASLQLLAHIAGHPAPPAMLVIATMRPEVTQPAAVLQDVRGLLAREPAFHRLPVRPFSVREVQHYLVESGEAAISPETIHALHERTGGNPFYLKELLHLLDSEQPTGWDDARAVIGTGVPESVRDVIRRRVARLPPTTQSILAAGAVEGRDLDLAVLERVIDVDAEQVLERLESAVTAGLLTEGPGAWEYRFTHALVQETLYTGLPRVDRARLHRRVGEALEVQLDPSDGSQLSTLADHFSEAARVGGAERAVTYGRAAAQHALTQLAFDDAVVYFRLALSALDTFPAPAPRERYELLLALGKAMRATGDVKGARAVLDRAVTLAASLDDDNAVIDAATVFGGVTLWNWRDYGVVDENMVAILEEQLGRLGDRDPKRRAALLGTLGVELYYGPRRSDGQRYAAEAVALARECGDHELRQRTLNNFVIASWQPDQQAVAVEALAELLTVTPLPRATEIIARMHRMIALMKRGDLAAFDADLARCQTLLVEARVPELQFQVIVAAAGRALTAERWDEADRLIRDAFAKHVRLSLWGPHWSRLTLLYLSRRAQGRPAEVLDELVHWSAQPGYELLKVTATLAACESGDLPLARRLSVGLSADIPPGWWSGWQLAQTALIATHLGAPDPDALYDALAPYADDLVTMGTSGTTIGSTHSVLAGLAARLGRTQIARQHAEAAAAAHERLGVPHLIASSRAQLDALT